MSVEADICSYEDFNGSFLGRRTSSTEGWHKDPLHVSEAHGLPYRSQHFGKPRKLSYNDQPCKFLNFYFTLGFV